MSHNKRKRIAHEEVAIKRLCVLEEQSLKETQRQWEVAETSFKARVQAFETFSVFSLDHSVKVSAYNKSVEDRYDATNRLQVANMFWKMVGEFLSDTGKSCHRPCSNKSHRSLFSHILSQSEAGKCPGCGSPCRPPSGKYFLLVRSAAKGFQSHVSRYRRQHPRKHVSLSCLSKDPESLVMSIPVYCPGCKDAIEVCYVSYLCPIYI